MSTVAIDTYKTINKLLERGYTKEQAEGLVEALTESELVSRDYLDKRLAETKSDIIKWVAAMLVAQAAAIVALQNLIG